MRSVTGSGWFVAYSSLTVIQITLTSELRMGLRSTHRDENRIELRAFTIDLAWNGEDRGYVDQLRPFPSLVWDACLNQFVSRHQPWSWW
jgi:hypothetical protein